MKSVLFGLLFFGFAFGQFIVNQCIHDGYYQCTKPIAYDWEEPAPSSQVSGNINVAFPVTVFGATENSQIGYNSFSYIEAVNTEWRVFSGYHGNSASSYKVYHEVKGTAPNRRMIITFDNQYSYRGPSITQLKYFEASNNWEFHTKIHVTDNYYSSMFVHGLLDMSYQSFRYSYPDYDHPALTSFSGTAMGMYFGPPSSAICGNFVLEGNEQCDGGVCCNSDCTFASSSQVCRAVDGDCDVAETCTGSSSVCPVDQFASSATPCNENFGVCDVRLARTCTGSSNQCSGFEVPQLNSGLVHWLGYSVISFGGFSADTGSVGGRLAVKGDAHITGGFSVGSDITIQPALDINQLATPLIYAFISGGNTDWANGNIFPDQYTTLRPEYGYVGGSFSGDAELALRIASNGSGNADVEFDNAKAHYIALSQNLAHETSNVNVTAQWSGLFFNCLDSSARYVVNLNAADFASATWFSVDGDSCVDGASWIFNIDGDMVFTGGDFPGVGEKILFNILGERNVQVDSGVNGNILAPESMIHQTGGVIRGLVIAGDIAELRSEISPSCSDLQPFSFYVPVQEAVNLGDNTINVVSFSIVNANDRFESNGATYQVTERRNVDGQDVIVLDRPIESAISAGQFLTFTVDPNQPRINDPVTKQISAQSSSSSLVASIVLMFAVMFF